MKELELVRKSRHERASWFDGDDDVSINAQLRTLNNIVGVWKGQCAQEVYILIFPFDFAGLCSGVHLNPLLCHGPNGEKTRFRKRHVERDTKRERSNPHWLSVWWDITPLSCCTEPYVSEVQMWNIHLYTAPFLWQKTISWKCLFFSFPLVLISLNAVASVRSVLAQHMQFPKVTM